MDRSRRSATTPKFLFGWRSALPAGLATKFGGFQGEARKNGGKAQPDQQSVGLFSDGVAVYSKLRTSAPKNGLSQTPKEFALHLLSLGKPRLGKEQKKNKTAQRARQGTRRPRGGATARQGAPRPRSKNGKVASRKSVRPYKVETVVLASPLGFHI